MASSFADTATSGPLIAALAVAALAGVASFFAPCMLPLVPGYLSYVTGLTGTDLAPAAAPATAAIPARTRRRGRAVAGSALFVAGFTAVFTVLAYAAGQLGRTLLVHARAIEITAGVLTITLGLAFMDVLPGLTRNWRITRLPRTGLAGAPLLGPPSRCPGRRACPPRSPPSSGSRRCRAPPPAAPSSPRPTRWGSGCRSSASAPACPDCCTCRRSCAATVPGSPASAARC
jgi:hypothetical protein